MYARHQAALAELTQAVLVSTALPVLMDQAAALVADTLAVPHSAIWELILDRSMLVRRFGVGWTDDATSALLPTSLIGAAVLGMRPVSVADWPSETRFERPPSLRAYGVISSLYVAIPGAAEPWGSVGVDVPASRLFSSEEIAFLQAVANVLALGIERAHGTPQHAQQVGADGAAQQNGAAHTTAVLEERQRLARDLHDSVTQALYGITLHAQAARRLLAANEVASVSDALRTLQDTAQDALDEMRLLIFELRPPILEQVGLVAALQARLNAVEGRANLEARLIADEVGELPAPVEQTLYRIAQEALNNALKYARARCIVVQLRRAPTGVMLEITDDGVGFDPASAPISGGVGLRGITERVEQLGGQLLLRSAAGEGTQLRVEVAL